MNIPQKRNSSACCLCPLGKNEKKEEKLVVLANNLRLIDYANGTI